MKHHHTSPMWLFFAEWVVIHRFAWHKLVGELLAYKTYWYLKRIPHDFRTKETLVGGNGGMVLVAMRVAQICPSEVWWKKVSVGGWPFANPWGHRQQHQSICLEPVNVLYSGTVSISKRRFSRAYVFVAKHTTGDLISYHIVSYTW